MNRTKMLTELHRWEFELDKAELQEFRILVEERRKQSALNYGERYKKLSQEDQQIIAKIHVFSDKDYVPFPEAVLSIEQIMGFLKVPNESFISKIKSKINSSVLHIMINGILPSIIMGVLAISLMGYGLWALLSAI